MENRYWKYALCFLLLGLVNNTGWVLVGTSSSQLAKDAGMNNLMPLFQL